MNNLIKLQFLNEYFLTRKYRLTNTIMFQQHLYRKELFTTMSKDDELVDTVKLHLREKIINKLKANQPKKQQPTNQELIKKICCSLFLDYLTENRLFHTASVFAPESGSSRNQFSKQELVSLFRVDMEGCASMLQAVLKQVMPKGRLAEKKTDSYAQTDDRQTIQNLENKLSDIDFQYKQKMALGYRSVQQSEQRFLKYKNQQNKRYKEQLQKQIDRIRNFELANIRMQEQERYKLKIKEYQEELDISYKNKMEKLRDREAQVIKRVADKMKDVEKYNYDARQRILRDMENVKAKEEELERLRMKLEQKERLLANMAK